MFIPLYDNRCAGGRSRATTSNIVDVDMQFARIQSMRYRSRLMEVKWVLILYSDANGGNNKNRQSGFASSYKLNLHDSIDSCEAMIKGVEHERTV